MFLLLTDIHHSNAYNIQRKWLFCDFALKLSLGDIDDYHIQLERIN